ncbi:unnamed protein product [Gongylonema pulchrum]|uniref:CCR4-NOT transcription complex subunit 11 n=1 Tax=Gongylonema pulchrum TaxID=637853 RepID=A0A183DNE6_9BILA|nr:unnamed protein product [Gongylonema pulchrum]
MIANMYVNDNLLSAEVLFRALERPEEAVMVLYCVACKKPPSERISHLKRCVNACYTDGSLENLSAVLNEYIDLLQRQMVIEVPFQIFLFYLKICSSKTVYQAARFEVVSGRTGHIVTT